MKLVEILRCGTHAVIVASMLLAPAIASSSKGNWKTECVGRYQMGLPGDVEVALNRLKAGMDGNPTYIRFDDGTPADRTTTLYGGRIDITIELSLSAFEVMRKISESKELLYKQELLNSEYDFERERGKESGLLRFADKHTYGWWGKAEIGTFTFRLKTRKSNRMFFYQASGYDNAAEANEAAQTFVRNFSPRSLYTLPKGEGVCIPYGFIVDNGKPARRVGVTMRLIEHPDVEIFFEDQSAQDFGIKQTVQVQERTELSQLWRAEAQSSKRIDIQPPDYHPAKLDGRTGTATFVEITQNDDSKDYGYAVVVNGDHTAQSDMPQLKFYIIRTASRAKGKPISKSEFKEMALKIADSIKRRAVN